MLLLLRLHRVLAHFTSLHFHPLSFFLSLTLHFFFIIRFPYPPMISSFQAARLSNAATFFVLSPSLPPPSSFAVGGGGHRRAPPRRTVEAAAGIGGGVRFDGPVPLAGDVEENDVVFEQCVTRTLPPALTLEEGLRKIKDAVEMLKVAPPRSSTGFLRFQVSKLFVSVFLRKCEKI